MRLAKHEDLKVAVDILSAAYADNPTVIRSLRNNNPASRVRLFHYQVREMILKKALHISSDNQGIIAYYKPNTGRGSLQVVFLKLKTLLFVTGFRKGLRAIRRNRKVSRLRIKEPCLYVWLLAVHPNTRGIQTIQELRNGLFSTSEIEGLPVYAETPMQRTRKIYERYGFFVYNTLNISDSYRIWLMRRPVKTNQVSQEI